MDFAPLSDAQEEARLRDILCQSFRFSPDFWETYVQRIGRDNFRIVRRADQVLGGLAIYHMGQWFGGRCLDNGGIAAVGIAPEARDAGVAAHLMSSTLQDLYAQEVPLSALYASTQRLYRKVGYQQAGSCYRYQLPLASIGLQKRSVPLQRLGEDGHEVCHDLARARSRLTNGNLERNTSLWERIVSDPHQGRTVYGYLIGDSDRPAGYLHFYQDAEKPGPYQLVVRDMVALTPQAARSLWAFFASHRSLASNVIWHGPPVEPLLMLPEELDAEVKGHGRWMLRVVNVPQALSERGYPADAEGELHLEVADDILPANQGRYVLSVAGGSGEVRPGGRGDLKIDVRGLSPLYTGFLSPALLQACGQLEADDRALRIASSLFAGPQPWMPDMF